MEKIFKENENLKVREELIGLHVMNPFIREISASRSYMMSSHFSQSCTPIFGEEKIIQSGIEKELGKNTFSKKTEADVKVLRIIKRYDGIADKDINKCVEKIVVTEDLETGEIDYISIPYYSKMHTEFGFKYEETPVMKNLRKDDILPKDTILADSPTVCENGGYKYGVNANVCLLNMPETAEDGIIISESMSERLTYRSYETRAIEFGEKSFPLNIYGTDKEYKPFPSIGEFVGKDSILCALRLYDDDLSPSLLSINDTMDFNPMFDRAIYVKSAGKDVTLRGETFQNGVVVDIKVYTNPKTKKNFYSGMTEELDNYANALKRFHERILETYEDIKKEHNKRYNNKDLLLSSKFHRLVTDSMALVNPKNDKIMYTNHNDPVDLYRVEFTIEYIGTSNGRLTLGNKLSDLSGSKGVIVSILPDNEMPYIEANGGRVYADVVMDPAAVVSRMNPGRLYEQYFCGMSRKCQYEMRKVLGFKPVDKCKDSEVKNAYEVLLGLLKLLNTEQLIEYSKITDMPTIRMLVTECVEKEVFLLYKAVSEKRPYQIVEESRGTIYEPEINYAHFTVNGKEVVTKNKILIAPIYTIILDKTAELFLAVASARTNHFNMPTSINTNNKNYFPWRNNAVKVLSETETRLYIAYAGKKFTAELLDRASNPATHKEIYNNILHADTPSDMSMVIDRTKVEDSSTAAMYIVENLMNSAGLEYIEVPEKHQEVK